METCCKQLAKMFQKVNKKWFIPFRSFPFSFPLLLLFFSFAALWLLRFPFLAYYRKSMRIKTNLRKIKENQGKSRKIEENQGKAKKMKESIRKSKTAYHITFDFTLQVPKSCIKVASMRSPEARWKPNRARSRGRVSNSFIKVGATEPL